MTWLRDDGRKPTAPPDAVEVEALVTDRYLDALMLAADRRALDAPSDLLDPSLRAVARRLSAELLRVHPSFRFEERLAARLADAAEAMRYGAFAVGAAAAPLPLVEIEPLRLPVPTPRPTRQPRRPSAVTSAVTSAALSLAGAAVVAVAWRRGILPGRAARTEGRA